MKQELIEVLSAREKEVFYLRNREKLTVKETAKKMGCSVNTVKEYTKRIKEKIKALEEYDITVVQPGDDDSIEEIFNSETIRMGSKKTINQVQFLAQCSQMMSRQVATPATAAERQMRSRNEELKKVRKRQMTEEEKRRMTERTKPIPRPDRTTTRAYMEYQQSFNCTNDVCGMASLEIILRAAGVIYRTPYINKLNRKTSMQMRAEESGYCVVMVDAGKTKEVPVGSKYIETIKNEEGNTEYSTWLFPSQFVCKNPKQLSEII